MEKDLGEEEQEELEVAKAAREEVGGEDGEGGGVGCKSCGGASAFDRAGSTRREEASLASDSDAARASVAPGLNQRI